MPTMSELRQANDQLETQMREWKALRNERGEDSADWRAFRQHVMAIGGADPGDAAPDGFEGQADAGPGGVDAAATDEAQGSRTDFNPAGKAVSAVNSLSAAGTDASAGDTATWPAAAGAGSETSVWPEKRADS